MIQKEFADVVFTFPKEVSKIPKVHSIVLFGSVARGEADARSDIDFLVVFDTERSPKRLPERRRVSAVALDLEKKFGKNISLVFTNRSFEGLDKQLVDTVLREGIVLYGGFPKVYAEKLELEPFVLVYFSLKKLDRGAKMRVKRALYGYRTVKRVGGKQYVSEDEGLLARIGGRRTGVASVLVPARAFKELKRALERFGAEYEKLDVWVQRV